MSNEIGARCHNHEKGRAVIPTPEARGFRQEVLRLVQPAVNDCNMHLPRLKSDYRHPPCDSSHLPIGRSQLRTRC